MSALLPSNILPSTSMKIETSQDYRRGIPQVISEWVSLDHVKCYRYGQESYFQESLSALMSMPEGFCRTSKSKYSYMLFKPDAFPVRCAGKVLEILESNNFEALLAYPISFTRHTIRELWRYEYNLATVDRYRFLDILLTAGKCLLVIVEDKTCSEDASIRLAALKGSSRQQNITAQSIRSQVGIKKGTLNFIHTPDSFIDMLRELGILFGVDQLGELWRKLQAGTLEGIDEMVHSISNQYPEHSLNYDKLLESLDPRVASKLRSFSIDSSGDLFDQVKNLDEISPLSLWDKITIINEFINFSVVGIPRIFDFEVKRNA